MIAQHIVPGFLQQVEPPIPPATELFERHVFFSAPLGTANWSPSFTMELEAPPAASNSLARSGWVSWFSFITSPKGEAVVWRWVTPHDRQSLGRRDKPR